MRNKSQCPSLEDVGEQPIRGQIFSIERLEEYALYLAENLVIDRTSKITRPLLQRLKNNRKKLFSSYRTLVEAVQRKESISPAAEWLVDNFHIVEEQIREITKDLPPSYYRELPKISVGELTGYPRVYGIALTLVAHVDSRLDLETTQRFIQTFQKKSYLNIGELWAIAITLRLALVENVRRISLRVIWDHYQRQEANDIADRLISSVTDPEKFKRNIEGIFTACEHSVELKYAFVAQLARRLRDQEVEIWPAVDFLESILKEHKSSIAEMVHQDHQMQAANQVTIANALSSMRLLSNIDWQVFFESVSLIDHELKNDATNDYLKMDFVTRNEYRGVIERIAKRTQADEREIVKAAVSLSIKEDRHVGHFLIGGSVTVLEKQFSYKPRWREHWRRILLKYPMLFYVVFLLSLTGLAVLAPIYYASFYNLEAFSLIFLAFLMLIPASDLAVSFLNYFVTHLLPPRRLPKLDLTDQVPPEGRTLVVIPCMLFDRCTIQELLEKLEVHYLGNISQEIYFALATDFKDADQEVLPEDGDLVSFAKVGIQRLNELYVKEGEQNRFFLFHRARRWNDRERKWMGWERKRGKLEELNDLLRGSTETSYVVVTCDLPQLLYFKYIITLDADTQLGRDNAKKLIGTALHPLNRPIFDFGLQRVVSGYGVLQPRISISLESSSRSLFAMIFSGHTGIDPYTTAVSDVYQDLFGEGSFTGKGLYDIDAFRNSIKGRVPENTVLSHDLLEGLFARTALVTDVEFLDDYPKTYHSFWLRQHRWVRGDWQIIRWILDSSLTWLSRWKIYDNLRRSLVGTSIILMMLLGWIFLPGSSFVWTLFALAALALPSLLHVTSGVFISPRGVPWTSNFWSEVHQAKIVLGQFFLTTTFLLHQAYIQLDAIVRALYRLFVSHRLCLEWMTAAQVDKMASEKQQRPYWQTAWPVWGFVLVVAFVLLVKGSVFDLLMAFPFLTLWGCYPLVSAFISRKLRPDKPSLNTLELNLLQNIARRTWHFFDTFVGPYDHWLPPDNVQEDPELLIAHRTSPTNMGLYILSLLAAKDLGFLNLRTCLDRLRSMCDTLLQLERFEGHFLNWYDTVTLAPLEPRYVSAVDSGNLAGYLLVLKQSCKEMKQDRLLNAKLIEGMQVSLNIIELEIKVLQGRRKTTSLLGTQQLLENVLECQKTLKSTADMSFLDWGHFTRYVHSSLEDLFDSITVLEAEHGTRHYNKLLEWVGAQKKVAQDILQDLQIYAPWIETDFKRIEQDFLLKSISLKDRWLALIHPLSEKMSLSKYQDVLLQTLEGLNELIVEFSVEEQKARLLLFQNDLMTSYHNVSSLLTALDVLHDDIEILFNEMNFKFLLDPAREVFHIGYNIQEGRHDNSFYDLLASESRLASFVAIAKGDTSQKHWFRLGRQLVPVEGRRALVSWSASMFEYLMPQLVMKDFENTLIHETLESVVQTQIRYAQRRKVPWGISEAGYNARDINFNYQYGPFGIPGLGLKRGLAQDLVVSPYSTFLALPIAPAQAMDNIRKLQRENLLTCYGFYEAIDFTRERLAEDQSFAVIRSFMSHHQGMSLVAISNYLQKNIMQRRFHSELRVRATQALLQERIPHKVTMWTPKASSVDWEGASETSLQTFTRIYENPNLATPRLQVLSNGSYSVMMTSAGGGYSKCNGLGITRWREDATRDAAGSFIFVKDTDDGTIWSTAYNPNLRQPDYYRVSFSEDMAEFLRDDEKVKTRTQVIVAPEDNVEIRHVTITNESLQSRRFEITSYSEPILSKWADDLAHPVFNNLFMETEFLAPRKALLARRRPRSNTQPEAWGFHSVVTDQTIEGELEYESDRYRFLGRGRNLKNAQVFEADHALSNTDGSTLDPIFSLRVRLQLAPGESCQIAFNTGFAQSREEILQLADRYHDSHIFEREKKLSWTKAHIDLRHFGIDADSAYLFQRLAERILFVDPSLRQPSHMLAEHTREQARLWPYGISGDLPLVVVTLGDVKDIGMLRKLLKGHEYLRLRGVSFDLIILNDSKTTYLMEMQDEIQRLIRFSGVQSWLNKSGGLFVLRLDTMPVEDRALMQVMARVDLSSERGSLKEQLTRKRLPEKNAPLMLKSREPSIPDYTPPLILPALRFFNGLGGFSSDGKEYIIRLRAGQWTPAPWINVIANQNDFGFQVSESGSGFTWAINSRENRLTGWSNDPVSDPPTEVIYLRDEDTGQVWTPTPLPIRGTAPYVIRHGQGYSIFEYNEFGFSQVLTLFVTKMDPVKVFHLRLKNQSERRRQVSITGYVEWVLGNQREKSAPYILTEFDEARGVIFAKNSYNAEFSERQSFFYVHSANKTFTCDRKEFIGRNGSLDNPEALQRIDLSSRKGIGLDPCGVLKTTLAFEAQEEQEVFFLLGQAENKAQVYGLIDKYSNLSKIEKAYHEVREMWSDLLEVVQVETPDPAVDIMLNRWVLYQALVCRMWARSAFYQSGGAYGFRDQLQDCMAFVHAAPDLVREHILRAASRQFPEGDVQHWWHPPTGRGVRTHFSDDLLWLPYVVSHYVRSTGDESILNEVVSFIEAPLLRPEQEDSYSLPQISQHKATLLEHCILAIERSLAVGQHGLPLIGSGDWNDGMNKIGEHGQGESVWMGWFLCKVLEDFRKFCNPEQQARYLQHIQNLKLALESQAWDGEWYRRAFFDDGTPLGSKDNDECKIDSISQSWSVLSGVGDPQRQRQVMAKVDEKLILWEQKIIPLLTPAFNKTKLNPGYIKGYAPGVRENGGQYTHAAIWVLMAFAELNRTDKAHKLFSILNPIHHGLNRESIYKYKVEPYVIAADIYSVAPHIGRGGWSWYTGSASWFYRAGLESLLGFFVEGDIVRFKPCTPKEWKGYRIVYKFKSSVYDIRVENVVTIGQSNIIVLENQFVCSHAGELKLVDDGLRHLVLVQNNIAEENVREATVPPQSL